MTTYDGDVGRGVVVVVDEDESCLASWTAISAPTEALCSMRARSVKTANKQSSMQCKICRRRPSSSSSCEMEIHQFTCNERGTGCESIDPFK